MDKYEFGKVLGQGSFGKVYNATVKTTGQNVVIKTFEGFDPTSADEKISVLKVETFVCFPGPKISRARYQCSLIFCYLQFSKKWTFPASYAIIFGFSAN